MNWRLYCRGNDHTAPSALMSPSTHNAFWGSMTMRYNPWISSPAKTWKKKTNNAFSRPSHQRRQKLWWARHDIFIHTRTFTKNTTWQWSEHLIMQSANSKQWQNLSAKNYNITTPQDCQIWSIALFTPSQCFTHTKKTLLLKMIRHVMQLFSDTFLLKPTTKQWQNLSAKNYIVSCQLLLNENTLK